MQEKSMCKSKRPAFRVSTFFLSLSHHHYLFTHTPKPFFSFPFFFHPVSSSDLLHKLNKKKPFSFSLSLPPPPTPLPPSTPQLITHHHLLLLLLLLQAPNQEQQKTSLAQSHLWLAFTIPTSPLQELFPLRLELPLMLIGADFLPFFLT